MEKEEKRRTLELRGGIWGALLILQPALVVFAAVKQSKMMGIPSLLSQ